MALNDESGRRIVQLRPLLEGIVPIQSVCARRAVGGRQPVARFAQRHEAGADEADVAGDIGVDQVLRRRLIEAQRREKLVPVTRRVDAQEALGGRVLTAEAGIGERHRLARPRERGEIRVDVGENRPVPRRPHVQRDVRPTFDVDRLVARRERLGPVGREILVCIGRVDRLDEQILNVV